MEKNSNKQAQEPSATAEPDPEMELEPLSEEELAPEFEQLIEALNLGKALPGDSAATPHRVESLQQQSDSEEGNAESAKIETASPADEEAPSVDKGNTQAVTKLNEALELDYSGRDACSHICRQCGSDNTLGSTVCFVCESPIGDPGQREHDVEVHERRRVESFQTNSPVRKIIEEIREQEDAQKAKNGKKKRRKNGKVSQDWKAHAKHLGQQTGEVVRYMRKAGSRKRLRFYQIVPLPALALIAVAMLLNTFDMIFYSSAKLVMALAFSYTLLGTAVFWTVSYLWNRRRGESEEPS